MKKLRKYLVILMAEVKSDFQYTFDILARFVSYLCLIFIFMNVWRYVYGDSSNLINGYSVNQMIWYIIVTEVIWSAVSTRKLCRSIVDDVKGGNITYNLNKPYSYVAFVLVRHLGKSVVSGLFYWILATVTGFVMTGSFPSNIVLTILPTMFICIVAIIITALLTIAIGLLAFFVEDSMPIYWIFSKFILIFGVMFPVEFFPEKFQPFIKYSFVNATTNAPAKLFVNFSLQEFAITFIIQMIYLSISILLCFLIFKKGAKKINVNGG